MKTGPLPVNSVGMVKTSSICSSARIGDPAASSSEEWHVAVRASLDGVRPVIDNFYSPGLGWITSQVPGLDEAGKVAVYGRRGAEAEHFTDLAH